LISIPNSSTELRNQPSRFPLRGKESQNSARLSAETNPLFTDDEAAKKGPYGGVIAPPSFATTFATVGISSSMFRATDALVWTPARTWRFLRADSPRRRHQSKLRSERDFTIRPGAAGTMVFVVVRSTLRQSEERGRRATSTIGS